MKTPPKAPSTKQPSAHLEVSSNWVSSHATAMWGAMLFLGSQISIWIHLDPWIEAQFCIPAGFTSFLVPNFSSNMLSCSCTLRQSMVNLPAPHISMGVQLLQFLWQLSPLKSINHATSFLPKALFFDKQADFMRIETCPIFFTSWFD